MGIARLLRIIGLGTGMALLLCQVNAQVSQLLWDFASASGRAGLTTKDLRISPLTDGGEWQLAAESGTSYEWPSLYLYPQKPFSLSAAGQLAINLRNLDSRNLRVYCRLDSAPPGNSDPKKVLSRTFSLNLSAQGQGILKIDLYPMPTKQSLQASDLFGMNGLPWFKPTALYTDNVFFLIIFVINDGSVHRFEIGSPRIAGPAPASLAIPDRVFPLVDEFGQFMHADWPGKTHSVAELALAKQAEAQDLATHPRPANWDKFGGWNQGPPQEATGKFYTKQINRRWWLVDPEGKLFFSQGVDVVDFGGYAIVDERSRWFSKLPNRNQSAVWGTSWSSMRDYHFGHRRSQTVNFTANNLALKYGSVWAKAAAELAHSRIASWGLNTIGNWSDSAITQMGRTAYVACGETMGTSIAGSNGYWRQFPDVWDPGFAAATRAHLTQRFGQAVSDPWCIGLFVDNELSWGDSESLARASLSSDPSQAAKRALADFLRGRYADIKALNQSWGQAWPSWDAFTIDTKAKPGAVAHRDLEDFTRLTTRQYFKQVRQIVAQLAPDRLYLGCRFSESNPIVIEEAQDYCDVVSFNVYDFYPQATKALGLVTKKPILIGEFHFGALDRGQFHPGLVPVPNQNERAQAYGNYLRAALADARIVGCHWFQYYDEPTIGRALDGENYQIGFLDGCDRPYPELIQASRAIGPEIYRLHAATQP